MPRAKSRSGGGIATQFTNWMVNEGNERESLNDTRQRCWGIPFKTTKTHIEITH